MEWEELTTSIVIWKNFESMYLRKNGNNPRKQILEKNNEADLETWGHGLEFNINEMIGLEYQLKVILNSG